MIDRTRIAAGLFGLAIFTAYVLVPPATEGAVIEQAIVWAELVAAGLALLYAVAPRPSPNAKREVIK